MANVYSSGEAGHVEDVLDTRYDSSVDMALTPKTKHVYAIPVLQPTPVLEEGMESSDFTPQVLGVLEVLSRSDGQALTDSDLDLLHSVAMDVGTNMHNVADMLSAEHALTMHQAVLEQMKIGLKKLPLEDILALGTQMAQAVMHGTAAAIYICEDGHFEDKVALRRLVAEEGSLDSPGALFEADNSQQQQQLEKPPGAVRQAMQLGSCLHLQPEHEFVDAAIDIPAGTSAASLFCMPLTTAQGTIFGTMVVYSPASFFLDFDGEVHLPNGILHNGQLLADVGALVSQYAKDEQVQEMCTVMRLAAASE